MERISILILKKLKSTLTPEESQELEEWANSSPHHRELMKRLTDFDSLKEEYTKEKQINWQRPQEDMQLRVTKLRRLNMLKSSMRYAAAATAVIIAAGAVLWFSHHQSKLSTSEPSTQIVQSISLETLSPGKVGARLTASNGNSIILEAADTTIVASKLAALTHSKSKGKREKQSLEVGRGQEFKIILEDSTEVWLNSESTLVYPEVFANDVRKVTVSGEACFHVTQDKRRPFIVEAGNQQIRVYGTTFNVRGYKDEEAVFTTLESGSVAISAKGKEDSQLMLSPGHQSRFDNETSTVSIKKVNTEIVTGWKDGKFVFEETPLSIIMKDLSRWYDFDYEFTDPKLGEIVFMGSVSRHSDFRTIIKILEDSGEVNFSIDNNRILISQKISS